MKTGTWLCLLAFLLGSCRFGEQRDKRRPKIFTDTVAYTYTKVHTRAADCGDKADSACTVANIFYPVFKDMPMLNDTVAKRLTTMFAINEKPEATVQQTADAFIASYTAFKSSLTKVEKKSAKDVPGTKTEQVESNLSGNVSGNTAERSSLFYTLDGYAKVVDQDSALVAIEYGGYTFQGGAHGASFVRFINWNPKAGRPLTLSDILVTGYEDKLTRVAEGIFRKEEKLKDTSSLARDYFFTGNRFALNNNYQITPLGLRYLYNEYEIKPYAAGQTELFIPYASISGLIKPGSVAAKFIKKNNAGI